MEYYSAIKKNESLPFATMWMELECITPSEISQSEKDKYHVISLICGISETKQRKKERIKKTRLSNTENKLVVARGGGWGMGEVDEGVKSKLTMMSTE